jgi:hypothetical protein
VWRAAAACGVCRVALQGSRAPQHTGAAVAHRHATSAADHDADCAPDPLPSPAHTHTHTQYTNTHTHTRTYTHTNTHTHARTHAHTHTHGPVRGEAHGHDCGHVQICRLVHDALGHHAAALVDHREEQEIDDVLLCVMNCVMKCVTTKSVMSVMRCGSVCEARKSVCVCGHARSGRKHALCRSSGRVSGTCAHTTHATHATTRAQTCAPVWTAWVGCPQTPSPAGQLPGCCCG